MNYRIYKNKNNWELESIEIDFGEVLKEVERIIKKQTTDFIVIEHDIKQNADFPIMCSIEDYLSQKEEYEGQNEARNMHVKCKLQDV